MNSSRDRARRPLGTRLSGARDRDPGFRPFIRLGAGTRRSLIASHADALRDDAPASTAITVSTVDRSGRGLLRNDEPHDLRVGQLSPAAPSPSLSRGVLGAEEQPLSGYAQLHGGFFDPEAEQASNATVFGFRAGGSLDRTSRSVSASTGTIARPNARPWSARSRFRAAPPSSVSSWAISRRTCSRPWLSFR